MGNTWLRCVVLAAPLAAVSCSGSSTSGTGAGGGNSNTGGSSAVGTGGATGQSVGGISSSSGGANPNVGGTQAATGGSSSAATAATGGKATTGGGAATGGSTAATTSNPTTGGKAASGGGTATGGKATTGGGVATGGAANGGANTTTGGKAAGGGTTGAVTGGAAANGGTSSSTGGGTSVPSGVTVQLDQTDQTIEGFGLNDTWQTIPSAKVSTFYSATSGIGMTILRTGMGSDGNSYNSGEASNISAVKSAAGSDFKLIGSAWTAAANCKDNNSTQNGGHLLSSCYDSWSTTMTNWASSNSVYAMSVANEPDFGSCGTADPCNGNYDSMVYTAKEMAAFLKVAGPKLQAKGIKVIAAEASEWNHQWSNVSAGPDVNGKNSSDPLKCGCFGMTLTATGCASTCSLSSGGGYDYGHYLDQNGGWSNFDIIGVHEYDSQQGFAWPSDITGAKKEVWVTEMAGVKWWPQQGPSSDIANGIAVAEWIHSALVTGGASAWLWWWYQPLSSTTNDNEGIYMQDGTDTKRHYTIGNYSKFVRPGYKRVEVAGNSNTDLLISAYYGSSTVVVVAINQGSSDVTVPISIAGGTAPATCTPNVTSSAANLTAGTAVTVSGGTFSAALAASTVTTFVCK